MPSNDPEYQKRYIRKHYQENKQYYKTKTRLRNAKVVSFNRKVVNRYKTYVGCIDCGYNRHSQALHFDHVRGIKRKDISRMVSEAFSLKTIKDEIRKCEVRCANCHAEVTSLRRE